LDVTHKEESDIYTFDFFYVGLNLTRNQVKALVKLLQKKCPELFECDKCEERKALDRKEIEEDIAYGIPFKPPSSISVEMVPMEFVGELGTNDTFLFEANER